MAGNGKGAHAAPAQAGAAAPQARNGRVISAILTVLIVALFLFGAAVALYPAYSNLYNQYCNARIAAEYEHTVNESDAQAIAQALADARAYNERHTVNSIVDPFAGLADGEDAEGGAGSGSADADAAADAGDADSAAAADAAQRQRTPAEAAADAEYESLLNVAGDGVMGTIDIPKIGQRLAMYHGVSARVLERGVGHLQGTSLPVGGEGSHCVLSGHRGLPSAALFTDLDQLEPGDEFFMHVLGETLAYQVDDVKVVKPEQTDALAIQPGADLVTLITCTPYAVNTHRLLVRGHRVPFEPPEPEVAPLASWLAMFSPQALAFAGAMSLVVIVVFVVFVRRVLRRDER